MFWLFYCCSVTAAAVFAVPSFPVVVLSVAAVLAVSAAVMRSQSQCDYPHRFQEKDEYLMRLEKMINPLLDDDDLTALTYILSEIMEKNIKTMQESWPFMKPVNKKAVKDYYDIVKQPMDLETMTAKIKGRKYHGREEFVHDMELIYRNSLLFNGETNEFTLKVTTGGLRGHGV